MQACTAAGYNRRQSLQDLGRMKLKSFLVQVLLPVTFSLALVSSSEAFSLPPLLSPPRAQNFWCKNPPSAQSCPLRTPFHRRTSHVQLHMKEDDQNGQPLSAAMRSGQIFWQDGYPVHDSSITSLVDSLHECDRRLRQRRWQVGSPLSLATLLLAFGSISIIGDLLGPQTPSSVEGFAQFSAALSLLMAGIPSFRRPAVALIVGASALADVTFSNGSSFPSLLGCLSFATAAYFAGSAASSSSSSSSASQALPLPASDPTTSPARTEVLGSAASELDIVGNKNHDLEIWSSRFGIDVQRDPNPMKWSVEDLGRALEEEGLRESAMAMQKAEIDGRVALGLSERDEQELRTELGLGLAQRRRLLELLARWRERSAEHEEEGGDAQV